MPYTRPDFDAAHATWSGAATYTRPAFNAANATWFVTTSDVNVYIAEDSGPLGTPSILGGSGRLVFVTVASPLGVPEIFVGNQWRQIFVLDSGLPLAFAGQAYTDPTPYIDETAPTRYYMELITDGVAQRVPISSWQATLQTDSQCYVQCVVPGYGDWADAVDAADEFVIYRGGFLLDGTTFMLEMARAPIETVQEDEGPTNRTGSISGYSDSFAADDDPSELYDRTLTDIRSITNYSSGGVRVRCGIDWLLRPAQRAIVGGEFDFVVSYINYIVTMNTSTLDAYMDVGHRVVS